MREINKTEKIAVITSLLLLKHERITQTEIKNNLNEVYQNLNEVYKHLDEVYNNNLNEVPKNLNEWQYNPLLLFDTKFISPNIELIKTDISILLDKQVNDTDISRSISFLEKKGIVTVKKESGQRGAYKKICSLKKNVIALRQIFNLIYRFPWGALGASSILGQYITDSKYGKEIINDKTIKECCSFLKMDFKEEETNHLIKILTKSPTGLYKFIDMVYIKLIDLKRNEEIKQGLSLLEKNENEDKQLLEEIKEFKWYLSLSDKALSDKGYFGSPFQGMGMEVEKYHMEESKRDFFEVLLLDLGKDLKNCYPHQDNFPITFKIMVDWSKSNGERLYRINSDKIELSF